MLTGRAALARPDIDDLAPQVLILEPHPGTNRRIRRALGQRSLFDVQLRRAARVLNVERTVRRASHPRKDGAIPTSGKARRNAKRNQRAETAKAAAR